MEKKTLEQSNFFININISHQLFDYKIFFVNSQVESTNSNVDFVLKNRF